MSLPSPKTVAALLAFRKDAKPVLDAEAFEMVKADVWKFYGWEWPERLDLEAGGKALFEFLIEKQARKR